MVKSSSDGIDRSGTSIPLGEYGDGWACTNDVAFVLAICRNNLRMVIKEISRPRTAKRPGQRWDVFSRQEATERHRAETPTSMRRTEMPQAREPICARIKATNSLARV